MPCSPDAPALGAPGWPEPESPLSARTSSRRAISRLASASWRCTRRRRLATLGCGRLPHPFRRGEGLSWVHGAGQLIELGAAPSEAMTGGFTAWQFGRPVVIAVSRVVAAAIPPCPSHFEGRRTRNGGSARCGLRPYKSLMLLQLCHGQPGRVSKTCRRPGGCAASARRSTACLRREQRIGELVSRRRRRS